MDSGVIVIVVIICVLVIFMGWSLGVLGDSSDASAQTVVNTNNFLESFLQKGGFLGGAAYLMNKRRKQYKKKR
jgi:hypothetical protein